MQRLRGIYKLTKKEILTLWGAEYPLRPPFSYVATRELLRRDAGIATSRRRKRGTGRGKVRVCHKKVFRQASRRICNPSLKKVRPIDNGGFVIPQQKEKHTPLLRIANPQSLNRLGHFLTPDFKSGGTPSGLAFFYFIPHPQTMHG